MSGGLPQTPRFGPGQQYPTNQEEWAIFIRWLLNNFQAINSSASLSLAAVLAKLIPPQNLAEAGEFPPQIPAPRLSYQPEQMPFPPNPALAMASKQADELNNLVAYLITKPPYPQHQTEYILYGKRHERQNNYSPLDYPLGTLFFETDSNLMYMVQADPFTPAHLNQWFYQSGFAFLEFQWRDTPGHKWSGSNMNWDYTDICPANFGQQNGAMLILSDEGIGATTDGCLIYTVQVTTQPTTDPTTWTADPYYMMGVWQQTISGPPVAPASSPLQPYDSGFIQVSWISGHVWSWNGTGYDWANGDIGSAFCVLCPTAGPNQGNVANWWNLVPVGGASFSCYQSNGTTVSIPFPAYTSFQTLNPGWDVYVRL